MTRNSGSNTAGRNPDGTFATGNPGKPKGSRNRATQATQRLIDDQSEAITQKAIEMALAGDTVALRLCIERIAPARKDAPVEFNLPNVETARDAAQAASALLRAVSEGAVTPLEGATVMGLLEQYRRTLEASDFEKRIEALEAKK
ncbi:hypothetical protein C1J05_20015 [Sulfitobacter sp. JL08]|uniref:DUF5681 domain-containing protein n=1 Tax=Sulfitobacter sp. JL08 TaxID=2070369 RepID=UPI000E0B8040|nr:DUF5681 domain-containing protein [Sulfitobacter sp. JL08]AXI56485.1 hypothetical protein C1J05_20015 [Sulfitobacter sp. JL08]